jgi:hypothetical protein
MIYVTQGQINEMPAVCSRNSTLVNPRYLWNLTHKLSLEEWNFIPYRIPPTVDYKPGYDLFCLQIDDSIAQSLIGTSCDLGTVANLHLIPGQYYYKVYEQVSSSNLNPNLASDIVNEGMLTVVGTNANNPTTYSGDTDVFIMYNPDND